MNVFIGADHGGFSLKQEIKAWLVSDSRFKITDCGATENDPQDDYPVYALAVARQVAADPTSLGILTCRSGGGMAVVANKIKKIRAVEVFDVKSATHARIHDHANIMTLGADWWNFSQVRPWIEAFLTTPVEVNERRLRRLQEISQIENNFNSSN